ncbi:MAG: mandelate racemase/muconate lactonizing enzyme family protein [Alphaproteobacteria bacterium]|nr:mandelate racemase/muconate lactonizing enzyme family protein [Alphaproteobacteria bacterium]
MKVTKLRTLAVQVPIAKPIRTAIHHIKTAGCLLVFVETDAGIVGESLLFTLNGKRLQMLDEMVRSLEPIIVGGDPDYTERFWREAWGDTNFVGQSGVPVFGIAAIDCALWDIKGKAARLPIYRLLGAYRDKVPTYASGGLWLSYSIDELVAETEAFQKQGFRAMKMRLGSPNPDTDIERVRKVREAIGPDIALMADANQGLTVDRAIRLGRRLEEFDLTWFEEPLPAYDHEGEARIAAALDTPIASGETEYTRYGFRRMLELKSADVLMPDLERVGGLSEFVKVAHMAQAYDVPVSSHIFSEMSVQILGGLANANYLEHMPWLAPLYKEALEVRDGNAIVPERPGWAFSFDMKAAERFRV